MDKLEAFTLREVLANSAERFGDRTAFRRLGRAGVDFHQVERLSLEAAMSLTRLGVKRAERVGLLAESCPEWGIAYLGIVAAGFVVVPILPIARPPRSRPSSSTPTARPWSYRRGRRPRPHLSLSRAWTSSISAPSCAPPDPPFGRRGLFRRSRGSGLGRIPRAAG
jgi:non-ribosomal peptide synthetase component F